MSKLSQTAILGRTVHVLQQRNDWYTQDGVHGSQVYRTKDPKTEKYGDGLVRGLYISIK
jgi:hypothetical protein